MKPFVPGKPTDMALSAWDRICVLPDYPTARHPFGQRTATIERSAIKITSGTPSHIADEEALAEEAGIFMQQRLGGV